MSKLGLLALLALAIVAASAQTTGAAHHGWKLAAWVTAASAATVTDVVLSRHCVAAYAGCHEANPMVPRGAAAEWAMQTSITAGLTFLSVHMWRRRSHAWAWPLVALTASHGVGAATVWRSLATLRASAK